MESQNEDFSDTETVTETNNLKIESTINGEPVTEDSFIDLLKVSRKWLTKLELSGNCIKNIPHVFELIGKHCPRLSSLSLVLMENTDLTKLCLLTGKCKKISHFSIEDRSSSFKDEDLILVLSANWKLEYLKLAGAAITKASLKMLPETMRSLDIRSCKTVTLHALSSIQNRCPNLKTLKTSLVFDQTKLDDIPYYWPQMGTCIICTSQIVSFKKFENIKKLFLHTIARGVSLNSIVNDMPLLENLQLNIPDAKDEILYFQHDIKILIIKSMEPLSHNIILSLPYCQELECLRIIGTDIWSVLEEILERCTSLRYLEAPDTAIEREAFIRMVENAKLKETTVIDLMLKD